MRSEPQHARTLVWALSISLAATLEIDVSFSSSGYLDVSVHRVPHAWLWIHHTLTELFSAGFPHSDISGSMDICSSPKLFAAYHVFHRLLVPRHPPCALFCITNLPNSFESILTGPIFRESLLSKERSCFGSDICEANVTEMNFNSRGAFNTTAHMYSVTCVGSFGQFFYFVFFKVL